MIYPPFAGCCGIYRQEDMLKHILLLYAQFPGKAIPIARIISWCVKMLTFY